MTLEIKNLKKTAKRIVKAIKNKQRIILYGDSDMDGVSSVIILQETIKSLGSDNIEIYFPDRENDGYGINEKALLFLKKFAPCLLISVDLGIGNHKEVVIAKKLCFEVIIIDHHEILKTLPKADIIVDPKQKGDKYPFKQFSTAGLIFKLSEIIFENKTPDSLRKSFLELSAMATIADMMPKTDDNAIIISEGLDYLKSTWRPGLKALFEIEEIKELDLNQKVYKVNSLLNVRDVENGLPGSFRLLTISSDKEAKILAEKLREKGKDRKEKIQKITEEIEARISSKESEPVVFEGDSKQEWDFPFMGVVASIITAKTKKPVFLYSKREKESIGSIRAPFGLNVVEAMKKFSKKLITYGGHPQAAGFRIKNEHLEEFKKHLFKYF